MFDYLSDLGYEIQARYQTVIRDIKSKSSSFYDAYLDLQEASIKTILEKNNVEYDESRTCGYLLRGEAVAHLFLDTLGVPKDTYEQIQDRTIKINHHKHHKQKHIVADSVIVFMETYHRFMKACCGSDEPFDAGYFRAIFGEYERVNFSLKKEKDAIVAELKELAEAKKLNEDQLKTYEDALALSQSAEQGLAEQNEALLQEISALKSLKLSILDQKLNRTIDMLNDLQEYVTESRAISMAVGYTVAGKSKIGEYIDLARKEMGRAPQTVEQVAAHPEATPELDEENKTDVFTENPTSGASDEKEPESILSIMTAPIPDDPTISEIIGEPIAPYLKSNNVMVYLDEKCAEKLKKLFKLKGIYLVALFVCVILQLGLTSWLKLFALCYLPLLFLQFLKTLQARKNLNGVSNSSPWIFRRVEIQVDTEGRTLSITRSGSKAPITKFRESPLTGILLIGLPMLAAVETTLVVTLHLFIDHIYNYICLGLTALIVFVTAIHSGHTEVYIEPRYLHFITESGTLVCDMERYRDPSTWHKEE